MPAPGPVPWGADLAVVEARSAERTARLAHIQRRLAERKTAYLERRLAEMEEMEEMEE